MPHKEFPLEPSTLEIIDRAMFNWVDSIIDAHSSTNKGWKKVPIIWVSAERAYQIKNDKFLRDDAGALKLPLVSVERTGIVKDPARKGSFQAISRQSK